MPTATALRESDRQIAPNELPAALDNNLDERLDELVIQALRAPDIDALLFSNRDYFSRFMRILSQTLKEAFENDNAGARHSAHRALFFLYEQNFEQIDESCA